MPILAAETLEEVVGVEVPRSGDGGGQGGGGQGGNSGGIKLPVVSWTCKV